MKSSRFVQFTWLTLGYTVLVILWGAFVRATGSGAGCGNHWPTCNGDVIHRPEQLETLIELTHRITSAFSGLLVLILLVWAFRRFPKKHLVRYAAGASFFFILTEGLIGALLVRLELVGDNDSIHRAIMIAIHLVNTFFLLAAIALMGWWAQRKQIVWHMHPNSRLLIAIAAIGFLILGASGAITALGDTLFPSESLLEGFQADFSPGANFLVRLRVYHPIIAIGLGVYLLIASSMIYEWLPTPMIRRLMIWTRILFITELAVGVVNVLLLAPVWIQIVHLLLADLVWITAVFLSSEALSTAPAGEQHPALQTGD